MSHIKFFRPITKKEDKFIGWFSLLINFVVLDYWSNG